MDRRSLGRGLSSLIPGTSTGTEVEDISVDDIRPNPKQPRKTMSDDLFKELVASVREFGLVQPIVVRPMGAGYELVAGERRWRAAREAGLSRVPAMVRRGDDTESLQVALIENIQREDLNAAEEARAYRFLIDELGVTHSDLAKRIGKDRSTITNSLRLLQLPEEIQALVCEGALSAGHARALVGVQNQTAQLALAARAVREGITVRGIEQAAAELKTGGAQRRVAVSTSPETLKAYREAEAAISKTLDTRVRIKSDRKSGGRIQITFGNEDKLRAIVRRFLG